MQYMNKPQASASAIAGSEEQDSAPRYIQQPETSAHTKLSVLYLDDQPVLLELFKELFEGDYDIQTAESAAEAVTKLRNCPIQIIISDYSLPVSNGISFLRTAQALCPNSIRILLTGQAVESDFEAELASGTIQLFIPKPWDAVKMLDALDRTARMLVQQN